MSDNQLTEFIERYFDGSMNAEERVQFELLRKNDAAVESKVTEHLQFIGLLKQYGERIELESRLNAIHSEIDVHALKEEVTIHPVWIVRMWRNHHSKISVAASVAIFGVLTILILTGKLNNDKSKYQQLSEKLNKVENAVAQIGHGRTPVKPKVITPANFRGTGFALTSNGYLATDYHVIKNADSVYVQNASGESFHAKVIYTEPQYDLAILQINDPAFKNLGPIPYNLKRSEGDLGESLYTLGYPADNMVYGAGYLASSANYSNDSTEYMISVPVNPGNSGGPLLDEKGNVIGVITARQTQVAGVFFAKKSTYLLKTIQNIPTDSLSKTLNLNTKNKLAGLSSTQQSKKVKNYVFMVKVYKQ
ncbi:S1C family serine protease [Mucilaginibacter rubeus]|uniref:Trypsin-like serine protease n=1 Tax=Mucilaginibacter rubeus TaxID=2027860 RepID=A0A5C1HVN3_9SPHI|nr:serine protease [Mucilaginibacter rubeus]QEM09755.1 trypsin-like serine protease [Mucilaginibacter rubeus]